MHTHSIFYLSFLKNPPANAGFDPWVGKTPGEGNGYSSIFARGNPMDRGAWQSTVHGIAKELDTT